MLFRRSHLLAVSLLATGCQNAATCDKGNVDNNGECVSAAIQKVRMTHLDVKYDLSKPVYVNNRVPVRFGLTADSVNAENPSTRNVAVMFSFVETNPSDPKNPVGCSSSAINVESSFVKKLLVALSSRDKPGQPRIRRETQ